MNDHTHDDRLREQAPPLDPHETGKTARGRRMLRLAVWSLALLLFLIAAAACGGLFFLRTSSGEAWLTATLNSALGHLSGGLSVTVEAFHGPLPSRAELSRIVLKDEHGAWLEAESASVSLDWSDLPKAVVITEVTLETPRLLRLPVLAPSPASEESSPPLSPGQAMADAGNLFRHWPSWLPELRLERLAVSEASFPAELLGECVVACLEASASAGRNGAELSLTLSRGGIPCKPLVLKGSFSPDAEGRLSLQGSDMGFLALLPQQAGQNGELLFSLSADISPKILEAHFSGNMRNTESGAQELAAAAQVSFDLPAEKGNGSLSMDIFPTAERFWSLAGQKGATLSATLDMKAEKGESLSLHAETDLNLSGMSWEKSELAALFGEECSLSAAAGLSLEEKTLELTLEEAALQAARIRAKAAGSLSLPGMALSPGTRVELHAEGGLEDGAALSPELSGGGTLRADISGPMDALSAHLAFSGDKLSLPGLTLEKAEAELALPHADIPRLLEELPHLFARVQKAETIKEENAAPLPAPEEPPLLAGSLASSLLANGQKTSLEAAWSMKEGTGEKGPGLLLSLERLALHLEQNAVEGNVSAFVPFAVPLPKEGTVAALAGTVLPDLDGTLRVDVRQWASFARLSGLKITGSPLNLEVKLSSLEGQSLEARGSLERLNIRTGKENIALAGLKTSLKARDTWGVPDLNLDARLQTLSLPALSLSRISAVAKGGEKGIQASAESHGDIRSQIKLRWKPGELVLQALEAEVVPGLLGLSGAQPAGLRLNAPATLRYAENRVSFSSLSLSGLPSGKMVLSGSWTPEKADITAELQTLDLGQLNTLFPSLPRGMVEGRVAFAGTPQRPSGNFMLNFKEILIPGSTLPPLDGEISGRLAASGKRHTLILSPAMPEKSRKALGLETLHAEVSLPLFSSSASVPMPDMDGPMQGDIAFSGDLSQLWKLAPVTDQKLSGRLNLEASLSGSLSSPVLTLDAGLENGSFADIAQGVEFRHIRLSARADKLHLTKKSENRLEFTFSADDNRQGMVSLSGSLDPATLALDVEGKINRLSPLRRQDASIMLSGTLSVSGTALDPSIRADITVDKGQVQLAKLPGGDIVTLPVEEPGQKAKAEAAPLQGKLNVRIHIPNQFFLRGYGLDCEWKGDIRLRGPLARPVVTGEVQAVRGTLDILGKRFKLSEGEITFDGGWPVSPALNVIMQYTSSSITADITVSGTAAKPEITLSSEPEMPQDEILSQIMFGKEANSLSHVQALQLAAGAAELAGFGGGGVMDFGRRILGLDVLKLNSEENDGDTDSSRTSLEMGTYVRDNVYVGVEQGLGKESETEAVVEIELYPGLEAQAKTSSSRTEVGLEWKKNY